MQQKIPQNIFKVRDQPWKQRVMRFYDYDRNIIEVGESLEYTAFRLSKEGYTIDEICTFTYLTREQVLKLLRKF